MFPIYNALTDNEIKQIHLSALKVLEEAGVAVSHPGAQEVLAGLGARISDNKKRAYFPPELVEKMLARAPREFLCAAREPQNDLTMKLGQTYARQGGGPFIKYDLRNRAATPLTMADAVESVRLVNALPQINAPSTISPQDIEVSTYDIATVKMVLENTKKHFWALTVGANHLKYELEMAAATVGGKEKLRERPILSGVFCVIAPLRFPDDEIDRLILCGEYGVNVMTPLTVLMGGSAPYTMAGAMTQMTAEFLAAVTIAQALCPGIGQWYYTLLQFLDMRSGRSISHGPEIMALCAGAASMSSYYGLPSVANTLLSGDCQPHQILFQYGLNIFQGLMSGITFQAGAGSLENGNLYSHQSLVIIDDILSYLKTFRNGLDISPEALAVDDIIAMAGKDEYLSSKLTLKYLRKEKRFESSIMNYPLLNNWSQNPETVIDRAEAKIQKILAETPTESVLPAESRRELNGLMASAAKQFSK